MVVLEMVVLEVVVLEVVVLEVIVLEVVVLEVVVLEVVVLEVVVLEVVVLAALRLVAVEELQGWVRMPSLYHQPARRSLPGGSSFLEAGWVLVRLSGRQIRPYTNFDH